MSLERSKWLYLVGTHIGSGLEEIPSDEAALARIFAQQKAAQDYFRSLSGLTTRERALMVQYKREVDGMDLMPGELD